MNTDCCRQSHVEKCVVLSEEEPQNTTLNICYSLVAMKGNMEEG